MAVVATLTKGNDLDYIWRQVDRSATKDAAAYYILEHLPVQIGGSVSVIRPRSDLGKSTIPA